MPRLEMLEDRCLPSTFTVANLLDSGAGSLRAAIAVAGNGDTINFAPALHGTITLTSGQLAISDSVTINGPGASKLSVSGDSASRVFDIGGSGSVSIAGLTITDGLATTGGGILLEGSAALSVSNCTLAGNVAFGSSAGSQTAPDGSGGAIEDNSPGALTVTNSTFDNNTAIAVGPNDPVGSSNYIFAAGGAIDVYLANTGSATISNSTFTGNQALGGSPGASAGGGAISNSSAAGATLTVAGCTISDNAAIGAPDGDGMTNFGSGQGGGINCISGLTLSNSKVSDNLAEGAPLAPDVIPSGSVTSNTGVAGGGIFCLDLGGFVVSTPVVIANCTISGNEALGASGPAPSVAEGGGISMILVESGSVTGCTVSDNVAQGGAGNPGVAGAPGASGGIDLALDFFSPIIVSNTTIANNEAIGGAGGAGANAGAGIGGGINVGTGVLLFGPGSDGSSLTLTNCTLADNQAVGGAGGSSASGGNGVGGGLSILGGSAASVSSSNIDANRAQGGAAGSGGVAGLGVGGGVYNLGAFADVLTVIEGNHASTSNNDIFP